MDETTETLRRELEHDKALAATRYPMPDLLQALRGGNARITGVHGPWLAAVLADLSASLPHPLAVVVPTPRDARSLVECLGAFGFADPKGRRAMLLPAPEVSPYAGATPDRGLLMQRLHVNAVAPELRPGDVVVASPVAWARRVAPRRVMDALSVRLRIEDQIDVEALRRTLLASGYVPEGIVEDPGTFSIRGDVIDIFSPSSERPVRVELYGDLVENLRWFDPKTQRSREVVRSFAFSPVREEVFTEETLATARAKLQALGERLRVPSMRTGAVIRDLLAGTRFFGIETLLPAFHERLEPFSSLLPAGTCVVAVEPELLADELHRWLEMRRQEQLREEESGELVFPIDEFSLDEASFAASLESTGRSVIAERHGGDGAFSFPVLDNADVQRARKQKSDEESAIDAVLREVGRWRELYGRIVVTCGSKVAMNRIADLVGREGWEVEQTDRIDLTRHVDAPARCIELTRGWLPDGFRAPSRGLAVLTERDVLGKGGQRKSGGAAEAHDVTAIASFRELNPGDLVVHVDFGIGRYAGIVSIDAGGIRNDFLAVDYAESDRLYVPVYKLARVQKYVGSAAWSRLDKLGGTTWEKTKARVRKQLQDIAGELLRIHAERKARPGYAYTEPGEAFRDFESAFPYEETPHQARAISEVMEDLQSPRPMDRLLCGDVGFGKTEVAMRAAFKAVEDGRQVAVLVPTTVLCEQHLATFRRRMADTAVRVEALSRFRSAADVSRIIAETKDGRVDILIGTHRLLSSDIVWKDLGLLVIDEEQRFGVRHKERIKELRATIDVLTMTATPIPRTLELSLLGIRDLSVILTPPPGRLAVHTSVARFKPAVLREGIMRELDRGGQVFFVHNRVETIYNVADELRSIVPEARIDVGHAQMRDDDLEKVMLDFVNRRTDVLVSTTIVESGIDIPTANTIFINSADKLGLAQLYQLRGRVGRGQERGFCYLLVNDPKHLTEDAQRRLDVIQTHTELGSGIVIAQQDLDIRGAGNILGSDQAGHVESIGFELFTELLEETIHELRGQPVEASVEPEVKIPVAAYIPEDWVEDVGQRLLLYKRFSLARDDDALDELVAELQERFGPLPQPVESLRSIVRLRMDMRLIGARQIEAGTKAVVVDLLPQPRLDPNRVMQLIKEGRGTWEFRADMRLLRHLKGAESSDILTASMSVARELRACIAAGGAA